MHVKEIFAMGMVAVTLLVACGQATTVTPVPAPTMAAVAVLETAVATPTALPPTEVGSPTATLLPSETPTSLPTATTTMAPTATVVPTATPDPYAPLTIEALAAREYGGGLLDIVDTLEVNETFTRYLITYPSDGLTIYGYMNVPNEGANFPVALVLHGYIDPAVYETVAYTRRYADSLAEAGYFVIHPNFRNYPPSDSGPDPFRIGYAIDVLNLIAVIREQSQDPTGYLRRADGDNIHLWGHSMGGGVTLRVITVNNADYIKAAVLYGSMSGDERLNYQQIETWTGGRKGRFELTAPPEMLSAISPIDNLERVRAAISVHHSEADDVVPVAWSEALCARLDDLDHPAECFTYYGIPHTFRGDGDTLFIERVIDFFKRY